MKTESKIRISRVVHAAWALAMTVTPGLAATKDLGNGFADHGVATPVSTQRGTVATIDGDGRDVVLSWLFDLRGGYALLLVDAETGKSEEFPMPFPPGGDCPYASILSTGNKFYTHFNDHFCEFDPVKRAFTFHHKTAPRMAMGMTEDDNGVIWSVTYPESGVVSFNPKTREFKDYGHVHAENWKQYQRHVVADDTGWIYFGIGPTTSHIIALDPRTGKARPMIPEEERVRGAAQVYRDVNGKVYGYPGSPAHQSGGERDNWYELHGGVATKIGKRPEIHEKKIITSSQGLMHTEFPDGKRLKSFDPVERVMEVENPKTKAVKKLKFDYQSEGAHVMGVAAAPDGTISGGTSFPMRFFSFNPRTDSWINRESHGQWNTVARQGDHFFIGGYGGGFLLDWDPSRPWVPTEKGKADSNPLYLTDCDPPIHRPHDLLAYPDGKTLVLAGTPQYGFTGGGLLFWNRETKKHVLLDHTDILPLQATMSLAALPKGRMLGGTTTSPGTGGEKKAKEAELFIMDITTRKLEWHEVLYPGAQEYTDLCTGPRGLMYGIVDRNRFFVFDPAQRKVIHTRETKSEQGSTNYQQGPRVFVLDPKGTVFMLFSKGIYRVEPDDFTLTLVAKAPVPIGPGGDYLDGHIYFTSGSHLLSYKVPQG